MDCLPEFRFRFRLKDFRRLPFATVRRQKVKSPAPGAIIGAADTDTERDGLIGEAEGLQLMKHWLPVIRSVRPMWLCCHRAPS
jgi:hypothetical protein